MSVRPEIILGPPGTGKTTTLLGMVEEELANGTHPSRMAYLSFTRRAAEEAVTRACTKFSGMKKTDFPYFRTLHSLCFKVMGLSSSGILEGKKLEEFGVVVGHKITGRFSLEDGTIFGFEKGDRLLFMENLARVRGIPLRDIYDEDDDDLSFHEVQRFSDALAAYKSDMGVIDFTDMLVQFVDSNIMVDIDVLFVDEAQDLSLLQWKVVQKLATNVRRLVIAGDDDQAIYRWAGADVDSLITMDGDVTVLNQSWRVPKSVQKVADTVVNRISMRRPKVWKPRDDEGVVRYHASEDSIDLSGPDILVLARNRYLLREFENTIRSQGYLYEMQGARSIKPSTLEAVITWERLRNGRTGVTAGQCRKMYEFMSVGKGFARGHKLLPKLDKDEEDITLEILHHRGGLIIDHSLLWFDALDKVTHSEVAYIRAALRRKENLHAPPRIRLSTIHGMKGGEANEVILLTDMAARTMNEARKNPDDEARVWYVAVTRARQMLHIIAPKTQRFYPL